MRAIVLILLPSKILEHFYRYLYCLLLLLLFSCNKRTDTEAAYSGILNNLDKSEDTRLPDSVREKHIDTAVDILKESPVDSVLIKYYRRAAVNYYDLDRFDKTLDISKKIIELSTTNSDSASLGKGYYFSALSYYQKSTPENALRYYQKAEIVYKAINHTDLGLVTLYKAYIFHDVGEFVFCESEAFKALRLLKEQKMSIEVFQCLVLIASALNEQDNTDDAIYYYQQALNQVDKFGAAYDEATKESYRLFCYHNIGFVYQKQKKYDLALRQYDKTLNSPGIKDNMVLYSRIINDIATVKLEQGERKTVKKMFFNSLKISDSINDKQGTIQSLYSIGHYYLTTKDTTNAISFFKKSLKKASQINSNKDRLNALSTLSIIDKNKLHKYSKEYINLNDSLQKVATKNRNKYARIEYETEQLKGENDALVRKNSFIIGVSVVVLLFVAAIFIIYYLNSRNKELVMLQEQQKANEEIYLLMFEQQERVESARSDEKNRIAMELHDGILNNIYAVRLNLEFSNRKSDDETILKRKGYIKELQSLETEIRAVSHDLSRSASLVQGKDFADMLNFLVKTQKNNFGTYFELTMDKSIDWENMPNTTKVNIYRIIQEAIQNINKYSEADHASVDIQKDGRQIIIHISDNGVGFDTGKESGGIGMKNLQQRTGALNGLIKIESTPGKGTFINVQFAI